MKPGVGGVLGVVADRRVGKNVYYGANHNGQSAQRERAAEITRLLARELPETSRDRTNLKLVLHKRQDKARKYFDELAGKFGRSYVPGRSWKALAHTLITLLPPLTVADLGAGVNDRLTDLGKNADGPCFPLPDGCDEDGRRVAPIAAVAATGPNEARPFA